MSISLSADEDFAQKLDAEDPLRHFRERFHLPLGKDGKPLIYFAGNSLGLMPKAARKIEFTVRTEEILDLIERHSDRLAVVMIGAVNFFTGQLFDIEEITVAAQKHGIVAGFDLAHAIGNLPLALHPWNVDFAVWCSYKYLNAG